MHGNWSKNKSEDLLFKLKFIQHCTQLYNDQTVEYDDLYGKTEKQVSFVKLYQSVLKVRKELLKTK